MGLFDRLFKRKQQQTAPVAPAQPVQPVQPVPRGNVTAEIIKVTAWNRDNIKKRFIAFDTETTGLHPETDSIIELGAVLFVDGNPTDSFSSLINIHQHIPEDATRVNHITDKMIATAPSAASAYKDFVAFLKDAITGDTVLCAHNARFDMDFLKNALMEQGYDGSLKCVDTLALSRHTIKDLRNYKQNTVAAHFDLVNVNAHRADQDAMVCGKIFLKLLDIDAATSQADYEFIPNELTDKEKELCAIFYSMIATDHDANIIRFYKDSTGYIKICCGGYGVFKFKDSKKNGPYALVNSEQVPQDGFTITDCTSSEGGEAFKRVFFGNPAALDGLREFVLTEYDTVEKERAGYVKYVPDCDAWSLCKYLTLDSADIETLKAAAYTRYNEEQAAAEEAQLAMAEAAAEKERKKAERAERAAAKAAKQAEKESRAAKGLPPLNARSRQLLQMDDDGNVLAEYASLGEAIEKTGINSKSIREAASGVQKHAGGFVWRYKPVEDEQPLQQEE